MSADILVLGKDGQLGRALAAALGLRALAAGRQEVDLAGDDFIARLDRFTQGAAIRCVINAAAYTQVDKAEGEGKAEAFRVNAQAVGALAGWCKARNVPLVHYSTDYVFDGSGATPRSEDAPTAPLNCYGESKLEGERLLTASGCDYLIFRTSWVYDAKGKNFFNTMLRLFSERETLKVVADQVGAPTYAPHLAAASLAALETALATASFPSGIYHLAGAGEVSWHGFAQAIFALATSDGFGQKLLLRCTRIDAITTAEYPLPAKRPLNSRLDCTRAKQVLGVAMPHWRDGLRECMTEAYGRSALPD